MKEIRMGHPQHQLEPTPGIAGFTCFSCQVHPSRHSFSRFLVGHTVWKNLKSGLAGQTKTPAAAIIPESVTQLFSTMDDFTLQWTSGDIFGCHIWRLLLALYSTMHRTAPTAKNYSVQSTDSAEVEKSCCHPSASFYCFSIHSRFSTNTCAREGGCMVG